MANLATTHEGEHFTGKPVERVRLKCHTLRQKLQSAADRAQNARRRKRIRKKLHRRAMKESNFRRNINHLISKRLVALAKDTSRGIALEDLKGIPRIRFRKPQRARMGGWGFDQLRQFIAYKAQAAGVVVLMVDPKHTSQQCAECGHTQRANRACQSDFRCRRCELRSMSTRLGTSGPRPCVNRPKVSAYLKVVLVTMLRIDFSPDYKTDHF